MGSILTSWFGWYKPVPGWSTMSDAISYGQRVETLKSIMSCKNTELLALILQTGWNVNETYNETYPSIFSLGCVFRRTTALHEAASIGWVQGVRMLLDAGAKGKMADVAGTVMTRALCCPTCPAELIELLLKHGEDPNYHDDNASPLGLALLQPDMARDLKQRIVQLLLEKGANPNSILGLQSDEFSPLSTGALVALYRSPTTGLTLNDLRDNLNEVENKNAALFKILVQFGANMNCIDESSLTWNCFFHKYLDVFFEFGGNLNLTYGDLGIVLQHSIRSNGQSNIVRWLVRHGAALPVLVTVLHNAWHGVLIDTPLVLLQTGMRVAQRTAQQLMEIQIAMCDFLENQEGMFGLLVHDVEAIWGKLCWEEYRRKQPNLMKHTFPELLKRQLPDLQEFSDESLHRYPDAQYAQDPRLRCEFALHQIQTVLEFLSQPQSLQWHCRRCVRENLVSLQPSVIKTLLISAILKRYILCHEV